MNKNTKILIGVGIFALVLILLVSFALAYSGRDVTLLKDRALNLNVNGQSVIIPLNDDQAVYDVPCLTTERDNVFILENDAGASIKVEGVTLQTGRKAKVGLSKISDNYRLRVTVETSKDNRTIYFRTKSSLLPEMQVSGTSQSGGEYFVTDADSPVMYKLDGNGNITWYMALSKDQAKGQIFTNLQKQTLENGDIRYTYQLVDPDVDTYGISDYFPGKTVVMNEKFEIMANKTGGFTRLYKDVTNDDKVPGQPVDGHGFVLLGDTHYISESYEVARVDNIPAALGPGTEGTRVAAAIVQEVKDNQVVFEWWSTDHPELYALSTAGNNYSSAEVQDYLHLNALLLDPSDNNLILSFKNADMLVKINREDGKIMWILGGNGDQFGLSDTQKFKSQTDATINADGSITVMEGSRAITYTLDEKTKAVTAVKEYPFGDKTVTKYGSAQMTGGDQEIYTIGWGVNKSGRAAITEYNKTEGKKGLEVLYPNGQYTFRVNFSKAEKK